VVQKEYHCTIVVENNNRDKDNCNDEFELKKGLVEHNLGEE